MPKLKTKPTRLPRRYKKGGKEIGNFFLRIGERDVNLRTTNAVLCLKRADEARAGQRAWVQIDDDTDAPAPTVVGTEAAKTAPVVEPPAPAAPGFQPGAAVPPPATSPTHTAQAALPPMGAPPPAGTPPQREPVQPDGYMPPPPGWADAVRGAAGYSGRAQADEEDEGLDEDFIEGMIEQGAALAVELQLLFHAWIIKKRLELTAGAVPETGPKAKARIVGARLWRKEMRKAIPADLGLPGWLAAPLMVAGYGLPVQIGDAVPIVRDPSTPPPASSSSSSATPTPATHAEAPTGETI